MAKRIVVLTGANRGLGRTTAEILVKNYSQNYTYIFTQRAKNHNELLQEFKKVNPQADVDFKDLDIGIKESRAEFKAWIAQKYKKIDVLFNNAGVYDKNDSGTTRPTKEIAQYTFDINFFNTVEFTEELYPLITDDGKIIEISSILGQIGFQPESGKQALSDATLTKEKIYQLAHNYINNAGDATKDLVFSNYAYHTSKALLNAYIRYVAVKYIKPTQSIFAVHPGWVQTDMGGDQAPLTKDQACPFLAKVVTELPYGKNPLSGKLQFENKEIDY